MCMRQKKNGLFCDKTGENSCVCAKPVKKYQRRAVNNDLDVS